MAERRAQLQALARGWASRSAPPARTPGRPGRTSGSSTRRTTAGTTSSSGTSCGATTPSGCTSTSASAAPTAPSPSQRAPQLPARAARALGASPFVEDVNTGLHSARTQIFTRFFPRCGIPDAYDGVAGLRGLRALPLRHRLDHRAHAALVERAPAPRVSRPSRSASATRSPTWPRRRRSPRSRTALAARLARAHRRGRAAADLPHRLIEENIWRAIRYGLSGELIDLERGEVLPARARLERLIEWVAPSPTRSAPRRTSRSRRATRPSARSPAGRRARRWTRSTPSRSECRSVADEQQSATRSCSQALRSCRSPSLLVDALDALLARLSRLSERAPRSRAGAARDRRDAGARPGARGPVPPELLRDFEQALANLQLAYAGAVAAAS